MCLCRECDIGVSPTQKFHQVLAIMPDFYISASFFEDRSLEPDVRIHFIIRTEIPFQIFILLNRPPTIITAEQAKILKLESDDNLGRCWVGKSR